VVELYDDASLSQDDYMIDSKDCAAILTALAGMPMFAAKAAPAAPVQAEQPQAEPVRYEYRVVGFGGSPTPWRDTSKERYEQMKVAPQVEYEGDGVMYEVRALYAALPAQAEQVAAVRAAEWISVEDRLPADGFEYLTAGYSYNDAAKGFWIETGVKQVDGWHYYGAGPDLHYQPTHWMPLPAAPSTATSNDTGALGDTGGAK
jgi:hypothetical protein